MSCRTFVPLFIIVGSLFAPLLVSDAQAAKLWQVGVLATTRAASIAEHALKSRLPTICFARQYVESGCLLSYSANFVDLYYRAAYFIDKILKGAKPADLPVEQPTKFEAVVNLKTANGIGLKIPESILLRADEVIR